MTAEAERYLRWLAEAELRRASGTARVEAAAGVLACLGAIGEPDARAVLDRLTTALAVRDRQRRRSLYGISPIRGPEQGSPPGLPDGDVQVVPIDRTLPSGRDGETLRLLTLAAAPGAGVAITVAGQIGRDQRPMRNDVPIGPYGPYSLADLGLTFTADGHRSYPGEIDGGGTCDGTWWCLEVLLPAPAARPGRLDIATADGSASVRVAVAAGVDVAAGAERGAAQDQAGQALDALAAGLLWITLWPIPDIPYRCQLIAMADAVREAGLLPAGVPALRRYAALTAKLGGDYDLASTDPAGLPAPWADVLAERARHDGPDRVYSTAAALPMLDGARFVVAGLVSTAESATLRLLAWGWAPGNSPGPDLRLAWWARDDTGRWHVGRRHWLSVTRHVVVLDVTLVPPLHPAATALEVIVTGRAGQVRATVRL